MKIPSVMYAIAAIVVAGVVIWRPIMLGVGIGILFVGLVVYAITRNDDNLT